MLSARYGGLFVFLYLAASSWGQQTPQSTTPPPAPQDPQAVSLFNQALTLAGGAVAISSIADYTASGNMTYHGTQDVQGTATVRALGMSEFRLDLTLPTGTRSWAIYEGETTTKAEDGTISQLPFRDGAMPRTIIIPYPYRTSMFPGGFAFPLGQVVSALNDPLYSITYKGVVELDGAKVHDIQVQRIVPGQVDVHSEYHTRDFLIDVLSLQVLAVRDIVPMGVAHEIRYSDYRVKSGLLMPFSIREKVGGRESWVIQLNQVSLNAGLQDSAFQIQ
jgi:hypothetical protein